MRDQMPNNEAIEMMNRCIHEIRELRSRVDTLQPKAEAYDNIAIVLNLIPRRSQGYGEDLIWVLQKRIQELQPKPAEPVNEQ